MKIIKGILTILFVLTLFFGAAGKGYAVYCDPYDRNCDDGNYSGTFDDITTLDYLHLTNEYSQSEDILWHNVGILNTTSPNANTNPYGATVDFSKGLVSPDYVAFNEDPTIESWMDFGIGPEAVSYIPGAYFYFPMFDPNDLDRELFANLTIKGFMNGNNEPVHTITVRLSNMDEPLGIDLSMFRVNSLHFIPESDNDVYDYAYFTVDIPLPAPEPSTMIIGALGIIGILRSKQKK